MHHKLAIIKFNQKDRDIKLVCMILYCLLDIIAGSFAGS